jgi:hypothetical protein
MGTTVWYQSKTLWGIGIAGICTMLHQLGVVNISPTEQADILTKIADIVTNGVQLAGLLFAIYGRLTANKAITLTKEVPK